MDLRMKLYIFKVSDYLETFMYVQQMNNFCEAVEVMTE